ncbi:Glycosyl transferase family 2 [anaerobic digester metagenome]
MPRADLISVVIATYNYARFLPAAITSALAQAPVPLEVIVVDDGSTDETGGVLERFSEHIEIIRQENHGLSAARNAGLARANGRHVVFLDADDLLPDGVLRSQAAMLEACPERTMSVCRNFFFETLDAVTGRPRPTGEWRLFRDALDVHLCHFNIAPPHAFLVRREAVERCGGFDTGLGACEDYALWFRLAAAGPPPLANPSVAVAYRRHAASMSRNLDRQHAHDALLHHRVAETLLRTDFPAASRPEGLLGCLAGCLLTHGRLEGRHPRLAQGLATPIRALLKRLAREASGGWRLSPTGQYFLLRIAMTLRQNGQPIDSPVRELLGRLFPDWTPAIAAGSDQELREALESLTARLVF